MKRNHGLIITIFLGFIFLTGCNINPTNPVETDFITMLKDTTVKDVNRSISIKIDPVNPSNFNPREDIHLIIYTQSNKTIKFTPGGNVQIFLFSEETKNWKEIKNIIVYSGEDAIIRLRGIGPDIRTIDIAPDYESTGKEQRMRVAVTGYIVKDEIATDEPVSAFVEFKIKP